ncbi:TldD/PmbA family protein, partial [bacterium]|nr:TldD/PmbA family protein [bacterium]
NPNYQSITPEFWGSCDAICNYKYWQLQGVANCGKGQPGQTAEMTHGSAPTRFRNIEVGIK